MGLLRRLFRGRLAARASASAVATDDSLDSCRPIYGHCRSSCGTNRAIPTGIDRNVEAVRAMLLVRMQAGLAKYGTTTERTDIDLAGWLQHLQEELLDAAVYVERIKRELQE